MLTYNFANIGSDSLYEYLYDVGVKSPAIVP